MASDLLHRKRWSIGISSYQPWRSPIKIRIDDEFTPDEASALAREIDRWVEQQRKAARDHGE